MERIEALREIAALRHNLHVNSSLRLEFLNSISRLLREYGISADDELLNSLILAVPEELSAMSSDYTPTEPDMPPLQPDEPMPPIAPEESPMPPLEPDMPPVSPDEPMPPIAPE